MKTAHRFASDESLQALDAEGEFTQGEHAFTPLQQIADYKAQVRKPAKTSLRSGVKKFR